MMRFVRRDMTVGTVTGGKGNVLVLGWNRRWWSFAGCPLVDKGDLCLWPQAFR